MYSILRMPRSLVVVCLTNLFSWMALVFYSLFFTHFVGERVYGGDPHSPYGSPQRELYDSGVRMGSFSMSMLTLTCCVYSLLLDKFVDIAGYRAVYIGSLLFGSMGAAMLAVLTNTIACFIFSINIGVLYATLFTMPYILIANYHHDPDMTEYTSDTRGLGTDITVVSSMVFLGQFIVSITAGSLIHFTHTTASPCIASSVFSLLAGITASFVIYPK